jgi:hypothetical protein
MIPLNQSFIIYQTNTFVTDNESIRSTVLKNAKTFCPQSSEYLFNYNAREILDKI